MQREQPTHEESDHNQRSKKTKHRPKSFKIKDKTNRPDSSSSRYHPRAIHFPWNINARNVGEVDCEVGYYANVDTNADKGEVKVEAIDFWTFEGDFNEVSEVEGEGGEGYPEDWRRRRRERSKQGLVLLL